jgi:hypothetical protein
LNNDSNPIRVAHGFLVVFPSIQAGPILPGVIVVAVGACCCHLRDWPSTPPSKPPAPRGSAVSSFHVVQSKTRSHSESGGSLTIADSIEPRTFWIGLVHAKPCLANYLTVAAVYNTSSVVLGTTIAK